MGLTLNFSHVQDLLNKAEREKERLYLAARNHSDQEVADYLFNFAVTAHHIADWIINSSDNDIDKGKVFDYISKHLELQACRDICNAGKHYKITRYEPKTKSISTHSYSASGTIPAYCTLLGPMGKIEEKDGIKLDYDFNGIDIEITMSDSTKISMVNFLENTICLWKEFLKQTKNIT